MRFLDTDIQINSETIFSLLKPVIPSPMTTGLLCLAGEIVITHEIIIKIKNKN